MVSDSEVVKKVRAERGREVDYSTACVCLPGFVDVHTCAFLCTSGGAEL